MILPAKWVFNRGEVSPLIDARPDLQSYQFGCLTLENWEVEPEGPVTFRRGSTWALEAKEACINYGFVYSETTAYVLELGEEYIRFVSNGAYVESAPSTPLEVATPYSLAECYELSIKAINDVVYIVHPSHAPRKLTRVSATSWTIQEVPWTYPPMLSGNPDLSKTLKFTADSPGDISVGDTGELIAAGHTPFTADHVGSYWKLEHRQKGDSAELDISASAGSSSSSSIRVRGSWSVTTAERWYGTLEVQRSYDGGTTWETIREFTSKSSRNVAAGGTQTDTALLRLRFTSAGNPYGATVWAGTAPTDFVKATAVLESDEIYLGGVVKVDTFNSSTSVEATVIVELAEDDSASPEWAEGAFSLVRGYPRNVGTHDGRLVYVGHNHNPKAHYCSGYDDYDNFEFGTLADSSFRFVAAGSRNPVQWLLEAGGKLLVGTLAEEYAVQGEPGQAVSGDTVYKVDGTSVGGDRLEAQLVDSVAIFAQYGGKRLWELTYEFTKDGYQSIDLTRLAKHIAGTSGWTRTAHARNPYSRWMGTRGDGQVSVLTYNRVDNVIGWSRMVTRAGDYIRSVAVVPNGSGSDDIYLVVERTVDGSTVFYHEVIYGADENWFDEDDPENPEQFKGLDCNKEDKYEEGSILSVELVEVNGTSLYGFGAGGPSAYSGYYWLVTTTAAHGLSTGYTVRLKNTGFDAINGVVCTALVKSSTEFYLMDLNQFRSINALSNTGSMPANGGSDAYSNTQIGFTSPASTPRSGFIYIAGGMSQVNNRFFNLIQDVAGDYFLDGEDSTSHSSYTSGGIWQESPLLEVPYSSLTPGTESGGEWQRVNNRIQNAGHLTGEIVSCLADGSVETDIEIVGTNGQLENYYNRIIYGLPYTGIVRTQKIEIPMGNGSSRGRLHTVHEVVLSLYRSWGLQVGTSIDNLIDAHKRVSTSFMDTPQPPAEDEQNVRIKGSAQKSPSIYVVQNLPLPATLRALVPKLEVNDA